MTNKNNVNSWLTEENRNKAYKRNALENASRNFDDNDALTVNTLEAIYGQESSFGNEKILKNDKRGEVGAAGHFQIQKNVAEKHSKTKITKASKNWVASTIKKS